MALQRSVSPFRSLRQLPPSLAHVDRFECCSTFPVSYFWQGPRASSSIHAHKLAHNVRSPFICARFELCFCLVTGTLLPVLTPPQEHRGMVQGAVVSSTGSNRELSFCRLNLSANVSVISARKQLQKKPRRCAVLHLFSCNHYSQCGCRWRQGSLLFCLRIPFLPSLLIRSIHATLSCSAEMLVG